MPAKNAKPSKHLLLVISLVHVPAKNAKPSKHLLEGVGGKGRGTYDTQRCSKKCECAIPHFNFSNILRIVG